MFFFPKEASPDASAIYSALALPLALMFPTIFYLPLASTLTPTESFPFAVTYPFLYYAVPLASAETLAFADPDDP